MRLISFFVLPESVQDSRIVQWTLYDGKCRTGKDIYMSILEELAVIYREKVQTLYNGEVYRKQ
jgi:hypothetical protein